MAMAIPIPAANFNQWIEKLEFLAEANTASISSRNTDDVGMSAQSALDYLQSMAQNTRRVKIGERLDGWPIYRTTALDPFVTLESVLGDTAVLETIESVEALTGIKLNAPESS